jgi:hypothetical protein
MMANDILNTFITVGNNFIGQPLVGLLACFLVLAFGSRVMIALINDAQTQERIERVAYKSPTALEPEPEPEPEPDRRAKREQRVAEILAERRLNSVCHYCGSEWRADSRGRCKACGAPRR